MCRLCQCSVDWENEISLCTMIIFLDIDGVMVPAKSWQRPELLSDGFPAFSIQSVVTLNHIIDSDTNILLTTSHKTRFSVDEWISIFEKRNIHISNLDKLKDNTSRLSRKAEIEKRFSNVSSYPEKFVIIDDDKSLNDLPPVLKKHLVLTSPTIGLTDAHLEKIRDILRMRTPVEV